MKTPLQEVIEVIKEYRDMGTCDEETCNTILIHIASMLQEEKHCIIGAYEFGWDDGANNYRPVSDVIYEDGEDYYNKKFNTKEK